MDKCKKIFESKRKYFCIFLHFRMVYSNSQLINKNHLNERKLSYCLILIRFGFFLQSEGLSKMVYLNRKKCSALNHIHSDVDPLGFLQYSKFSLKDKTPIFCCLFFFFQISLPAWLDLINNLLPQSLKYLLYLIKEIFRSNTYPVVLSNHLR